MTDDQAAADTVAGASSPSPAPVTRGRRVSPLWIGLILAVIVVDVFALIALPQTNKENPADACAFPACFIQNSLEFPAPHNVITFNPNAPAPPPVGVYFEPGISNTILTMWIVMAIVLVGAWLLVRRPALIPRRGQNAIEAVYEFLSSFGIGIAGAAARPYIPIFAAAFLLILFDNWIGLVPIVGRTPLLRAPSSDVNITLGMALVSFLIFHIEGFRKLGFGGYLGKFFPFYEFKNGLGAGIIALFVGLVELMLEFVKPVTLSMRLFGNIYGGEVALGVITTLTIGFVPVLLLGLELMLNAIQALIFSVLTLMFIVLAIESHHEEEGHIAEDVLHPDSAEPGTLQPAH